MPNINLPKSYSALPSSPTLADLVQAIGADTSMWKRRRQEIVGGLRSLASAIGRPPGAVPAMPGPLQDVIRASQPWRPGVGGAELDRLRKLTRAALERAGLSRVPGRYGEPLSRRWHSLLRSVENPGLRLALSPLCRFASGRGVPPGGVDDVVSGDFLEALRSDALLKDVRSVHRLACKSWNRAAGTVPGWPKRTVTVPDYRDIYEVPWSDFPITLKADLDRYIEGAAARTAPVTGKPYGPWSPATGDGIRKLLHSYVSAAVRGGSEPSSMRSMSDVVETKAVREALNFLLARSGGRISVQTGNIALAVASVARNWVGVDETRQAELDALRRRVTPPGGGLSDRHRLLLRQFDKASNISAVLRLPSRLMRAADASEASDAAKARMFQTALLVELLSVAPVHVGELARLGLANLTSAARRGRWKLTFLRSGRGGPLAVEIVLPERTRRLLCVYLRKHRPVLAPVGSTAMFPGRSGNAKTDQIIRRQVSGALLEFTGLRMTPNLFRHFAAKHFLESNPGEFQVVRFALGHRSLQTTLDKYSDMDGPAAFRSADEAVLASKPQPSRHKGRVRRAAGTRA